MWSQVPYRVFFENLNDIGKPKREDIIEKDYHLHQLLHRISNDPYLGENLAFKGGTCLSKAYLGYYRFSEGLDFTWKDSSIWRGRSATSARKRCSKEIDDLLRAFSHISEEVGLSFDVDKANKERVQIGSGGRMVSMFIGYHSEISGIESDLKVEVNFIDNIQYPFRRCTLDTYIGTLDSDRLKFIYPGEYGEYSTNIEMDCYSPEEIFIDKARASLTRRTHKMRDIIDIYFLERGFGLSLADFEDRIILKTIFMMDLYRRYRDNIQNKKFPSIDMFKAEEMKLLIIPPPSDLDKEIRRIQDELEIIRGHIVQDGI